MKNLSKELIISNIANYFNDDFNSFDLEDNDKTFKAVINNQEVEILRVGKNYFLADNEEVGEDLELLSIGDLEHISDLLSDNVHITNEKYDNPYDATNFRGDIRNYLPEGYI